MMRCEASRPDGAAAASWQEWSGRVARGAAAFLGSVLVAQVGLGSFNRVHHKIIRGAPE